VLPMCMPLPNPSSPNDCMGSDDKMHRIKWILRKSVTPAYHTNWWWTITITKTITINNNNHEWPW
jgi:hypothetical protein